jgi:hypothetical protein
MPSVSALIAVLESAQAMAAAATVFQVLTIVLLRMGISLGMGFSGLDLSQAQDLLLLSYLD